MIVISRVIDSAELAMPMRVMAINQAAQQSIETPDSA